VTRVLNIGYRGQDSCLSHRALQTDSSRLYADRTTHVFELFWFVPLSSALQVRRNELSKPRMQTINQGENNP